MTGRVTRAFGFAMAGWLRAWREQPNLRVEIAIAVAALALTAWLAAPVAPIVLAIGLVLASELANSAVEATVDLLSPERRDEAAAAKDLAAGAVLMASVTALAVGLIVLGPPLLARLAAWFGGAT
ncbi:MAG: diacylglycerol kinase [Trueperaceae bacterium]